MNIQTTSRSFERFLTLVGAAACVIVAGRVWQVVGESQSMWPLPGLYLIELAALSVGGAYLSLHDGLHSSAALWVNVGVFCAFIVMGAWSIGLFFLPTGTLFLIAALLATRRHGQRLTIHLALCAVAAIGQVALMLVVIRIVSPNAI